MCGDKSNWKALTMLVFALSWAGVAIISYDSETSSYVDTDTDTDTDIDAKNIEFNPNGFSLSSQQGSPK